MFSIYSVILFDDVVGHNGYLSVVNAMTKLHNITRRSDIDDYIHSSSISSSLYYYDLPELDGLDNIHSPDGPLLHALKLASNLYHSYRTWFLINGSSSGIMIAIFSFIYIHKMKRRSMMNYNNNDSFNNSNGDDDDNDDGNYINNNNNNDTNKKINKSYNNKSIFLICRDAHKSVFDSLSLSHDCDAILIPTIYDDNFKVTLSITIDSIKDVINYINNNYDINDICGLIITRPTYQG